MAGHRRYKSGGIRSHAQYLSDALSEYIGLGLFTAARIVEQEAGIESLPAQINAAYALGLYDTAGYKALLPQAFRIILPPLSSGADQLLQKRLCCLARWGNGADQSDEDH